MEGSVVTFTADGADVGVLRGVDGVRRLERGSAGGVTVTGSGPLLARVGYALVAHGLEPADLQVRLPTLEDAYLRLTSEGGGPAEGRRPCGPCVS